MLILKIRMRTRVNFRKNNCSFLHPSLLEDEGPVDDEDVQYDAPDGGEEYAQDDAGGDDDY
jgi:hypothetical protein